VFVRAQADDDDGGELDADAEAEKGIVRDESMSLICVMANMSDFKKEKCLLQKVSMPVHSPPSLVRNIAVILAPQRCVSSSCDHVLWQVVEDELGGLCTWLPKFHAPCNGIEYVWGNGKKRNRKMCDFTMKTLRTRVERGIRTRCQCGSRLTRIAPNREPPCAASHLG
jgi:hypothetical protein